MHKHSAHGDATVHLKLGAYVKESGRARQTVQFGKVPQKPKDLITQ